MGRGSSKAGRTSGVSRGGAGISADGDIRLVNKATFKNHGGGNHTMDIPGVGGAQALSTEGPTGNTLYDVTVWNADNDIVDRMNSFTTLNEAKSYAKDALRGNIMERVYR